MCKKEKDLFDSLPEGYLIERRSEMKNENGWDISFKTLKMPLIFLLIFLGIGIWRSVAVGHVFYLLNFGYIGDE